MTRAPQVSSITDVVMEMAQLERRGHRHPQPKVGESPRRQAENLHFPEPPTHVPKPASRCPHGSASSSPMEMLIPLWPT